MPDLPFCPPHSVEYIHICIDTCTYTHTYKKKAIFGKEFKTS